jgi:hypothetical protein
VRVQPGGFVGHQQMLVFKNDQVQARPLNTSPMTKPRSASLTSWPAHLNPKSEIETGNLPQSLGHKRIEKISTDHFGYASIFSIRFCSKILRHLAGLNFGFRD